MNHQTHSESYIAKQTSPTAVAIHQASNGRFIRSVNLPPGGRAAVNGSTLEVRKSSGQVDLYTLPDGRYVRTL